MVVKIRTIKNEGNLITIYWTEFMRGLGEQYNKYVIKIVDKDSFDYELNNSGVRNTRGWIIDNTGYIYMPIMVFRNIDPEFKTNNIIQFSVIKEHIPEPIYEWIAHKLSIDYRSLGD